MEIQRIQNSQNKNKVGRLTLTDLKIYYKAATIKTVWYQHTHKETDLESLESPDRLAYICTTDF